MVPADDEQHPETTQQQFSSDNATSTHSNDAPRLTPMPRCLMHWWTPLAIAEGLLRWTLIVAFFWGGQPHWPSSEAMKLCMTITGAGLAFSAWQQRSHDNAVRDDDKLDRERAAAQARAEREEQRGLEETRRLEQIERDEYWKRREQIYQLLGSENPGLRLGAIELLAELADKAARSTLLNKTEVQQLQHHIIDTLCLQIRHEGIANDNEGTKLERAEVQQAIIEIILSRINSRTHNNIIANWSQETINLNNSTILTKVSIHNIDSMATLNLENSEFKQELNITNSSLGVLAWENATFPGGINIGTPNKTVTIYTKSIPQHVNLAKFINTIFITENEKYELAITGDTTSKSWAADINLQHCSFWSSRCTCSDNCECKVNATVNDCRCRIAKYCNCPTKCTNATLIISDHRDPTRESISGPRLKLNKCRIDELKIRVSHLTSPISIANCTISNGIEIMLHNIREDQSHKRYPLSDKGMLTILHNNLITNSQKQLVAISLLAPLTMGNPFNTINIAVNFLIRPSDYSDIQNNIQIPDGSIHTLACTYNEMFLGRFHFEDKSATRIHDQLISPWDTGHLPVPHILAMSCSTSLPEQPIDIRPACETDLDSIMKLYESVYTLLNITPLGTSWANDFKDLTNDTFKLNLKQFHIIVDKSHNHESETIIAAFTLSNTPKIPLINTHFEWRDTNNILYIDHIAAHSGQNVARQIFCYAIQQTSNLRCISDSRNEPLRHALEVFGFKECGTFTADDGSTRIAYDWIKELDAQD